MFTESARVYDALYGAYKDYAAEAERVAALIRAEHPTAASVLDVGCGTGEHVRHLRQRGFSADGLDLEEGLLDVARQKVPEARFFAADMSACALGLRFDVVMCLFSSIGYLKTLDRVTAALICFRDHLAEGGVVIVEPWFPPGTLKEGPGPVSCAKAGGLRVERASRMIIDGLISRIVFDYRLEDDAGVRLVQETHELGLFTPEELMRCFDNAGLRAAYDPEGLTGRGLYVARVAG